MTIRPLTPNDLGALLECFNAAFSGYYVPLQLGEEQLTSMLVRRGWVPELSLASFDGERMTGFVINCADGQAGYNSGTGTIPAARGRGVARALMENSIATLREHGLREYQLEVIEANLPAIALYESLGFAKLRSLDCWMVTIEGNEGATAGSVEADWKLLDRWSDVKPSWQNSDSSVRRAREESVTLGDERGRIVVFPSTGDVPMIAVDPRQRRRGLGRSLVRSAAAVAGRPLRFINVDAGNAPFRSFFDSLGAKKIISQFEMARTLS